MSRQRFAVFDIDGTITRWQFFHAMGDAFVEHGFVTKAEHQKVIDAKATWKKRSHIGSYHDYEQAMVQSFLLVLDRITPQQFDEVAAEVFEQYKDETYTYTRNLVRNLKAKNYKLFVISGSPREVVERFADYYGFDDFIGTDHHTKNGKFTGEVTVPAHHKHLAMQEFLDKHDVTHEGSIGVGDSKGDISMLEMTKQPIAFNPDKALYEHARERGWKIVVERKSIIYELDKKDGQFVLA
jgi:HAD superfamily hydrolase (TIGR01490 family)